MRFTYSEAMTDPSFCGPLAQAAEEAGYASFIVPDSLAYPKDSDSTYPYTPDGSREFLEGKAFFDPFVLIAALGAATTSIRFTVFVLKLPIRHPVLVAKQAGSAAWLTDNRLDLGVGISPWPEDFAIVDVPWERRGKRMDECMDVLRALLAGGFGEFHGELYDVPPIALTPAPTRPVPLLVGGHSDAALKRAVTRGDGWVHAGGQPDELTHLLARLAEIRAAEGRQDDPFQIHVASLDAYTVDGVRRLEDAGVTDAIVGFRWPYQRGDDTEPLQTKVDNLRRYADDVIAQVS